MTVGSGEDGLGIVKQLTGFRDGTECMFEAQSDFLGKPRGGQSLAPWLVHRRRDIGGVGAELRHGIG